MIVRKCPVSNCDFKHQRGFFNIPDHPVRRKAWTEACELPVSANRPICWKHFKISDFKKEISADDLEKYTFGQLKKNVVPSQRLPGATENVENQSNSAISTEISEIQGNVETVSKVLILSKITMLKKLNSYAKFA